MKKIIFIIVLFNAFILSSIYGQNEYANSDVTVASSFNDFANVYAHVTAGAGYYWFFVAVDWADWWNGSSWSNLVQH
jgi:hypothetical protein